MTQNPWSLSISNSEEFTVTLFIRVHLVWWHPTNEAGDLIPTMGTEIRETNRRIRSHILSHTRSVSHLAVELVLVDAVRSSRFADVAGSTGKHQTVVNAVFFGVKQVGTT